MRLGENFYRKQVKRVQNSLEERELDGLLILNHHQIYYLIGFFHYPSERPIGLFIPRKGDPIVFIPKLEENFIYEGAWAPQVEVYFEYPGVPYALDWIAEKIGALGHRKARLGLDQGLSLASWQRLKTALPTATWAEAGDILASTRLVKEPEEIELHRRAAAYADWMLAEGVRMVRSGKRHSEIEIEQAMVRGVIHKMQAELDPVVAVPGLAAALVCSGPRSAFPHGLPTSRRIAPGENLILSVGCFVGGYFAESERTFILGEPSEQQRHRYETDRLSQETGTQALIAGSICGEVNKQCLDVIREAGLGEFIKHRQGHGVGIQNHEPPWIEDGDRSVLSANMLVSCEPGIYCPGQGGYRISDTVLIASQGPERLTKFPRDLNSIVIPLE